MQVTVHTVPCGRGTNGGRVVTTTVTVQAVSRLGCGCDRAETRRPHSSGGVCPELWLWPAGCHHRQGIDFDAARTAAQAEERHG